MTDNTAPEHVEVNQLADMNIEPEGTLFFMEPKHNIIRNQEILEV